MATNLDDWSGRLSAAVREFTERAGPIDALETAATKIADAAAQLNASGVAGEPARSLAQALEALCEINSVLLQRVGELKRKLEGRVDPQGNIGHLVRRHFLLHATIERISRRPSSVSPMILA